MKTESSQVIMGMRAKNGWSEGSEMDADGKRAKAMLPD